MRRINSALPLRACVKTSSGRAHGSPRGLTQPDAGSKAHKPGGGLAALFHSAVQGRLHTCQAAPLLGPVPFFFKQGPFLPFIQREQQKQQVNTSAVQPQRQGDNRES